MLCVDVVEPRECVRKLCFDRDVPVRSGPGLGFVFPVRVVPSGPVPIGPGPIRSGSQFFSGPGFHLRSGFHIFPVRVCPVRVFQLLLFITSFFRRI